MTIFAKMARMIRTKRIKARVCYTNHSEAFCSNCAKDLAYPHPKKCPKCGVKFENV